MPGQTKIEGEKRRRDDICVWRCREKKEIGAILSQETEKNGGEIGTKTDENKRKRANREKERERG